MNVTNSTTSAGYAYYVYSSELLQFINTVNAVQYWLTAILIPIVTVVGIPGNILVIVAFSSSQFTQFKTACFYYVVMAVNDTVVLVTFHVMRFISVAFRANVVASNIWVCSMLRWLWFSGEVSSAMLIFGSFVVGPVSLVNGKLHKAVILFLLSFFSFSSFFSLCYG
jgi:hypothetical protein